MPKIYKHFWINGKPIDKFSCAFHSTKTITLFIYLLHCSCIEHQNHQSNIVSHTKKKNLYHKTPPKVYVSFYTSCYAILS